MGANRLTALRGLEFEVSDDAGLRTEVWPRCVLRAWALGRILISSYTVTATASNGTDTFSILRCCFRGLGLLSFAA
jgi:hypothetical protein